MFKFKVKYCIVHNIIHCLYFSVIAKPRLGHQIMGSRPHPSYLLKRLSLLKLRHTVEEASRYLHRQSTDHSQSNVFELNSYVQEQNFPFASARLGTFTQEAPRLGNQFLEDALLQSYLKRHLPEKVICLLQYATNPKPLMSDSFKRLF